MMAGTLPDFQSDVVKRFMLRAIMFDYYVESYCVVETEQFSVAMFHFHDGFFQPVNTP